jgi:hypothetical protein
MVAKHGIPTSEDIHKGKPYMENFLLASQRLTRSGQGETPYHYFELYLVTVAGFPSVALAMMGYYSRYPAIAQQNLATLFPFLDGIKDNLTKTDPASPFSGATKGPAQSWADRSLCSYPDISILPSSP